MFKSNRVIGAAVLFLGLLAGINYVVTPTRAADVEPQVTATLWTDGKNRVIVYYPDQKKVYAFKTDGKCDTSWTIDAPGAMTETKCK